MNRNAAIAARRAYTPPVEARRQWRVLLDAAEAVTAMGQGARADVVRLELSHLLTRSRPAFPGPGATADLVVEGFLKIARAFVTAGEARRAIYGPALSAVARALNDLIHEQQCAEAEGWQRTTGERD